MAGRMGFQVAARLPQAGRVASRGTAGLGWSHLFGVAALGATSGAVGAKAASKWFIKPPVIPPPTMLDKGSKIASFGSVLGLGALSYVVWRMASTASKKETQNVIGKQARAYSKGLGKARKNALTEFNSKNPLVARNKGDSEYTTHINALEAAIKKAKTEFDAANPWATKAEREKAIEDAKAAFEKDNATNKGHYDDLESKIEGIRTKHKADYDDAIEKAYTDSKAEFIKNDTYKHLKDTTLLDSMLQFHEQYGEKAKYQAHLGAEQQKAEDEYKRLHTTGSTLSPTALANNIKKERARVKVELDQKRSDARACAQDWNTYKKGVKAKFHVDNKEGIVKTRGDEIRAERDGDQTRKDNAKAYSDGLAAKKNAAAATVKGGVKKLSAEKRAERSKKAKEAAKAETTTITGTVEARKKYIADRAAAEEAATVAYEEKNPKQTNGTLESLKLRKKDLEAQQAARKKDLDAQRAKKSKTVKSALPKVGKGAIKRVDKRIADIEARQKALAAKAETPSADKAKKGQTA